MAKELKTLPVKFRIGYKEFPNKLFCEIPNTVSVLEPLGRLTGDDNRIVGGSKNYSFDFEKRVWLGEEDVDMSFPYIDFSELSEYDLTKNPLSFPKKILPLKFVITKGHKDSWGKDGISLVNDVYELMFGDRPMRGSSWWYSFDFENKKENDASSSVPSEYDSFQRIHVDDLVQYDLKTKPTQTPVIQKKPLPLEFVIINDGKRIDEFPRGKELLRKVEKLFYGNDDFEGTNRWYYFDFVNRVARDGSFGSPHPCDTKIEISELEEYDLETEPVAKRVDVVMDVKAEPLPLPDKFVISARDGDFVWDDSGSDLCKFFDDIEKINGRRRGGIMRHYYYDMSEIGPDIENFSARDVKRSDHFRFREINPDNVKSYDANSYKAIHDKFLEIRKEYNEKQSKWYLVENDHGPVSDDPFGLMLCQYLEKMDAGEHLVGNDYFYVQVKDEKIMTVSYDLHDDIDFGNVTPRHFVLNVADEVFRDSGYELVTIGEVRKESNILKLNRFVTEPHSPFFDSNVPMACLPVGENVVVLVKKDHDCFYGVPDAKVNPTFVKKSFVTQYEFFDWFNPESQLSQASGYEVFRIVSEFETDCLSDNDFFPDVCDVLEDTCNGGVAIDGDLDELFVVMKDKKPVQVLKYEPRMKHSDVPVDDFYADYCVEEDRNESKNVEVRFAFGENIMDSHSIEAMNVQNSLIDSVNDHYAITLQVSQEDLTIPSSPTMNGSNNMLSEILKTQFFSDEANQAAIASLTEKYEEFRKVLSAAQDRVAVINSKIYDDLLLLNAAINRNDVTEIKRILSEFKETSEYVENFLNNEIGSIYEPADEEFDVKKKFGVKKN